MSLIRGNQRRRMMRKMEILLSSIFTKTADGRLPEVK